jgi:hypothetical protein
MDLTKFWGEHKKPKRKEKKIKISKKFIISALVVLLIGVGLGLNLPRSKDDLNALKQLENVLGSDVKLPEVDLSPSFKVSSKSLGLNGTGALNISALKVLSANLIGIPGKAEAQKPAQKPSFKVSSKSSGLNSAEATDSAKPKLAGIRILGEVENTGKDTVRDAKIIIRFFRNGKLIAKKLGAWNQTYKFIPLSPGEINVYDVLVPSPPESDSVTIEMEEMEPGDSPKPGFKGFLKAWLFSSPALKIKEASIKPAVVEQQGQKLSYYKFSGTLVNTADWEISNPGIYVWIRNDKGKVIGIGSQFFESDLLIPEATLEAKIAIVPVSAEEMFDYKVKTFGKKL